MAGVSALMLVVRVILYVCFFSVSFFMFFFFIFAFRFFYFFFFSSRRRHTRYIGDWSSDVCSSDLPVATERCREVCASSTRLDQVTTWQAADRYRNNEGPAVAREALAQLAISYRSEERRVGKECRSRWRREQKKKKKKSDGDDDCEY